MKLKSKISNFWFYYWKPILIGLVVVVAGVVLLLNFVIKPVDVKIAVLTNSEEHLNLETIRDALVDYTPDRNADKTVNLEIRRISPSDKTAIDRDTYLFLVDPDLLNQLEEQTKVENVSEGIMDLETVAPNNLYLSGKGYNIIGSPFQEKFGISGEDAEAYFKDGFLLVLRAPVKEYSAAVDGYVEKYDYIVSVDMMKSILSGKPIERAEPVPLF